jgi:hypothetical protein
MFCRSMVGFVVALLFIGADSGVANAQLSKFFEGLPEGTVRTLRHVAGPPYIVSITPYERTAQRSWIGEFVTVLTAPEQLYYTKQAAARFGFNPDDAEKYVQIKRDLINEVTKKRGEDEYGVLRADTRFVMLRW